MFILGYRDRNDTRYYVPLIVYSARFKIHVGFNFLIDTGATRTQLSWLDANHYGVIIRNLPPDGRTIYTGMTGGAVKGYLLPECTLIFKSNVGRYDLPLGNLSVSDYLTTDGNSVPIVPSVLGIDVLDKFDLLFEGGSGTIILRLKTSI